jgi:CRP-like cAMP-binding protein
MITNIEFDHLHIFEGLSPIERELLIPLFIRCDYQKGDVLFEQGDAAENLYLVVEGELAVRYKPEDGPQLVVARVQENGMVGWSAALGRSSYTSSVDCLADCLLLKISRSDLKALCRQDSEICSAILDRLAVIIAERLSNTHNHVLNLLKQGICQNETELVFRK